MTENNEKIAIAVLQTDVTAIKEHTACLPDLAKLVERHDERIKSIDKIVTWGFGILGSIIVGIIVAIITQRMNGGSS